MCTVMAHGKASTWYRKPFLGPELHERSGLHGMGIEQAFGNHASSASDRVGVSCAFSTSFPTFNLSLSSSSSHVDELAET